MVGKLLVGELKQDLKEAAGPIQVCAGHEAGAEAAIHAMQSIFDEDNTQGILLIDATNAFNSLNRKVAMHNILILCPRAALTIINTYRLPSRLFLVGGGEMSSQEGTTQGDPLAMPFYAVSISIIIYFLRSEFESEKQVWLADDATAAGDLHSLLHFLNRLIIEGAKYGYYVNPGKSWLILKNETDLNKANDLFQDLEIQITTEGQRLLGAVIGAESFKEEYVANLVSTWCLELEKLSSIAISQPQAAFSAFTLGYRRKFTYYLRTIPNIADLLRPLEDLIATQLLPSILGQDISKIDREISALPTRYGGLGIPCLHEEAEFEFNTSITISDQLAKLIIAQSSVLTLDEQEMCSTRSSVKSSRSTRIKNMADSLDQRLSPEQLRTVTLARDKGASGWLNVLPLEDEGYVLNKEEFRDALALRYNKSIPNLPSQCLCGKSFNPTHAMVCKTGGFIHARHDNVKNLEASLLSRVCKDVAIEPSLLPVTGEEFVLRSANIEDDSRLDVKARGFYRQGQTAFFDIRIAHLSAESNKNLSTEKILARHENEKKRAYNRRVLEIEHGSFTPLVFGSNGAMGRECATYHKLLAQKISLKEDKPYAIVMSWIRTKLSFSLIKSALLCLRGSRRPFLT